LPLQLRHVPSSSAPVSVLADAFGGPSNGSSGGGGGSYGGVGLLPAAAPPTRRSREFIPESTRHQSPIRAYAAARRSSAEFSLPL